jgi:hypothetical protein
MVKKIEKNIISRYSWIVILCSSCRLHNYGIQMNGYVEIDEEKTPKKRGQVAGVQCWIDYVLLT